MSSPHNSLGKTKKFPFHRPAPFRPAVIDIESIINADLDKIATVRTDDLIGMGSKDLVEDATSSITQKKRHNMKSPWKTNSIVSEKHAPSDMDLMNSMMGRISQLQLRVQFHEKEIAEKENQLRTMQQKLKLAQINQKPGAEPKIETLERENKKLRKQVYDMEEFLADYGMMWVGDSDSSTDSEEEEMIKPKASKVWHPDKSVPEFKIDYDQIIDNIRDLNVLAGEGETKVHHTVGGAELKRPDPINLSLYANGILMFNGPFRPFSEPTTQQCAQDLMDGYFPTELQKLYPEGVLFSVHDRRHSNYEHKTRKAFEGQGQVLGGEAKPSRLVPANLEKSVRTTNASHVDRITADRLLNKLPSNVIKKGKVIDIRQAVSYLIKGEQQLTRNVTVINTSVVETLRKSAKGQRLPESEANFDEQCTTLRIKYGEVTYVLVMKYAETIGDVRQHLSLTSNDFSGLKYDLSTSYPRKVYSDDSQTLEDAGLIPNAMLHLQVRN